MTFTRISVLVPTRRRVARLETLLASWKATVPDPSQAELLFRVDDDDAESRLWLTDHDCKFIVGPRYQGYRSLPQFFGELASCATGDLVMTGNDDMVFRTQGWPSLVIAAANEYPDGLFCLGVDTHNAGNYPFSIISKAAVDVLGFVHDSRLFWGDVYLRDVMSAFRRTKLLRDVRVDHEWAGHAPDQTFIEANQKDPANWSHEYWALHRVVVHEAVERLDRVWHVQR